MNQRLWATWCQWQRRFLPLSSPFLFPPAPALTTPLWGQNPQQIKILLLIFPSSAPPHISVLQHQLSLYFCLVSLGIPRCSPLGSSPSIQLLHSNYMAPRTSHKWIIACFFPSQPKGFWKSNFLITLEDIWRKKKKATCSLHTKCGRVEAGSPSPRPLELLRASHRLLPAPLARDSYISPVEGCHQADINYCFMNDLASILAARNNFSLTDLAESTGTAPCLLAGISFNFPFWCFSFGGGGLLWMRGRSFSSYCICSCVLPNSYTSREGADLCPALLQLLFGAAVVIAKANPLPDCRAQGQGKGGQTSDGIHQVVSLPAWPSSSKSTQCFCPSTKQTRVSDISVKEESVLSTSSASSTQMPHSDAPWVWTQEAD